MRRAIRVETALLTPEEIAAAIEGALTYARGFGEDVDAKTVDLRLWAAAALIDSTLSVSLEDQIRRSLEQKLAFMKGTTKGTPS